MKKEKKGKAVLPAGFSLARIEAIRKHYDSQSDSDAANEDDAMAAAGESGELLMVPVELVPVVREMVNVFRARGSKSVKNPTKVSRSRKLTA